MPCDEVQLIADDDEDGASTGADHPYRAARDGLEDRLRRRSASWLITRRISPGGRLLLQRLGRGRRCASSSSVEQPRVLDGDDGLVGERLEQRDLPIREGLGLVQEQAADDLPARNMGVATMLRYPPRRANSCEFGKRSSVEMSGTCRSRPSSITHPGSVSRRGGPTARPAPRMSSTSASHSGVVVPAYATHGDRAGLQPEHAAAQGAAEAHRALDDGVEDWLELRPRCTDHAEDRPGGRLLLERLGQIAIARLQLAEQTRVLDRDHRLLGEGLQEGDLVGANAPGDRPSDVQRPDGDASRSIGTVT